MNRFVFATLVQGRRAAAAVAFPPAAGPVSLATGAQPSVGRSRIALLMTGFGARRQFCSRNSLAAGPHVSLTTCLANGPRRNAVCAVRHFAASSNSPDSDSVKNSTTTLSSSSSSSDKLSDETPSSPSPSGTQPQLFAVVEIGSHQYKLAEDDQVTIMRLPDVKVGSQIELPRVLLVGSSTRTWVGQPYVSGCAVRATVEQQTRANKIIVFKKKRRKRYQRTKGHRQDVTTLRIDSIKMKE